MDTLSWAHNSLEAAATHAIGNMIKELLTRGFDKDTDDFSFVTDTLFNRVSNLAKYPKFSTSPIANIMHQLELAECAMMHEQISQILSEKN